MLLLLAEHAKVPADARSLRHLASSAGRREFESSGLGLGLGLGLG